MEALNNAPKVQEILSEAKAYAAAVAVKVGEQETLVNRGEFTIETNPSAEAVARSADPSRPSSAEANAFGLGLGTSGFYADNTSPYYQAQGFNSPNLQTLKGAQGTLNGKAEAIASTSTSSSATTEATAINIGLTDINLESSDQTALQIGTNESPYEAYALAASTNNSLADSPENNAAVSELNATAITRGIETPLNGTRSITGQPDADVAATAYIAALTNNGPISGEATADAIALQADDIRTTPRGNDDDNAVIRGKAEATTGLKGLFPINETQDPVSQNQLKFVGQAIGIDAGSDSKNGSIKGNSGRTNLINANGKVILDLPGKGNEANQVETDLKAVGIQNADISTGIADDVILATAAISTGDVVVDPEETDLAAMRNVNITSGLGDDMVVGGVSELPTQDESSSGTNPFAFNAFDGQDNSEVSRDLTINSANTVETGIGDDGVYGYGAGANNYVFDLGIGQDNLLLDNAWNVVASGGLGDDLIMISDQGTTQDVSFFGGHGNDVIQGGNGDGELYDGNDRIDGGSGIDRSTGGGGRDTFVYSQGIHAMSGTSSEDVNERWLEDDSWNTLPDEEQVQLLQQTDRVTDFMSGSGNEADVLELSSTLGGITADQWSEEGVLMSAEQAINPMEANKLGVVVDSLENIQAMGMTNRNYAIAVNTEGDGGLLLYNASGNFDQGTQVVAHLSGDLGDFSKKNIQFA